MGVTVHVDGWHEQPSKEVKIYLSDRYPNLDDEDFAFYGGLKDEEGRYYELERVYENPFPELYMTNGNWRDLADALGISSEECIGAISHGGIPMIMHRCVQLTNSGSRLEKATRPESIQGNIVGFGTTPDYIRARVAEFMDILKFAQQKNKGIYWG